MSVENKGGYKPDFKKGHQETRDSVLTEWQQKWPLNSEWLHDKLGKVRVVDHFLGDNTESEDIRVVGGLKIADQSGKEWSVYSPQLDLHVE